MDTNLLKLIYLYFFVTIPFAGYAQMPSTPNSPYTVRWYQVSQNPNSGGNSMDSVVSQYALNSRFASISSQWINHANGIYYNGKASLGGVPDGTYKFKIYGTSGISQINSDVIRNNFLPGSYEWNFNYGDFYSIYSGRNKIITINNAAVSDAITIGSGVGIYNTSPSEAFDITGNIKVSGTAYIGTVNSGTINDRIIVRNATTKKLYSIPASLLYDNNYDSTVWTQDGNYLYPKNINSSIGLGTLTPDQGIHLVRTNNAYFKATGNGSTAVAGFMLNNSDQTWSTRVRGDISDQFEIFDNTSNKIPFSIQKGSHTYTMRINADSSVTVFDFIVSDSITANSLPHSNENSTFVTTDDDGNFHESDFGLMLVDSVKFYIEYACDPVMISGFVNNKSTIYIDTCYNGADHGLLSGIEDDDHLQYALLDGREDDSLRINYISSLNGLGRLTLNETGDPGRFYFELYDNNNYYSNVQLDMQENGESSTISMYSKGNVSITCGDNGGSINGDNTDITLNHINKINLISPIIDAYNNDIYNVNDIYINKLFLNDSLFMHHNEYTSVFIGEKSGNPLIDNGYSNTAVGYNTLTNTNETSIYNTAIGFDALHLNTYGYWNTAVGAEALYNNTLGISNNAFGHNALVSNVEGSGNSAFGEGSLEANKSDGNTAFGAQGFLSNQSGFANTGIGFNVMTAIEGSYNIGIGYEPGWNIQTGSHNILIGDSVAGSSDDISYELNIGNLITGTLEEENQSITLHGQVYTPDIEAEEGSKFYQVVGLALDGRQFPKTIAELNAAIGDTTLYMTGSTCDLDHDGEIWLPDHYVFEAMSENIPDTITSAEKFTMFDVDGNNEINLTDFGLVQKLGAQAIFDLTTEDSIKRLARVEFGVKYGIMQRDANHYAYWHKGDVVFDSNLYAYNLPEDSTGYSVNYNPTTKQISYYSSPAGGSIEDTLWLDQDGGIVNADAKTVSIKRDNTFPYTGEHDLRIITDNKEDLAKSLTAISFEDQGGEFIYPMAAIEVNNEGTGELGFGGMMNLYFRSQQGDEFRNLFSFGNESDNNYSLMRVYHPYLEESATADYIMMLNSATNNVTFLEGRPLLEGGAVIEEVDPVYAIDSAQILKWADTTAVSGIGIATYDDLRNLDLTGDNLGDHNATTDLNMAHNNINTLDTLNTENVTIAGTHPHIDFTGGGTIATFNKGQLQILGDGFMSTGIPTIFGDSIGINPSVHSLMTGKKDKQLFIDSSTGMIFIGDTTGTGGATGDNLGDHIATTNLDMNQNGIDDATGLTLIMYATGANGPTVKAKKSQGTESAPRRVGVNGVLGGINGFGSYAADDVTDATMATLGNARFQFFASEAFTSTSRGTHFAMFLTPIGSTSASEVFRITNTGFVGIKTSTPTKQLEINSTTGDNLRFIYNSTANTIDFTTSSSGDLTITPSGGDIILAGEITNNPTNITLDAANDRFIVYDNSTGKHGDISLSDLTSAYPLGNYAISLGTATVSVTNGVTWYIGTANTGTSSGYVRVYIPKAGTIKSAYVHMYCSTAGDNSAWKMEIEKNGTSYTEIETVSASASSRTWDNTSLNIAVTEGDWIAIRVTNPTWGTNPATPNGAQGVVFIEY